MSRLYSRLFCNLHVLLLGIKIELWQSIKKESQLLFHSLCLPYCWFIVWWSLSYDWWMPQRLHNVLLHSHNVMLTRKRYITKHATFPPKVNPPPPKKTPTLNLLKETISNKWNKRWTDVSRVSATVCVCEGEGGRGRGRGGGVEHL